MNRDAETIRHFISEINEHKFWKYYEIKACLIKYSDNDKWKVGFVYIRLLGKRITVRNVLPEVKRLKLIHRILDINTLDTILTQISHRQKVKIGGIYASLELITTPLKYQFYWNSHPYTAHFGIDDPSYGLNATGDYSEKLVDTLEFLRSELPTLSTPFQDLRDACRSLFNLQFGTPAFSHFVVIFAPIPISIGNVDFSKEKIAISLITRNHIVKKSSFILNFLLLFVMILESMNIFF